jgi:hypothetical protein
VAEIRDATPEDFDAVFELVDARSRAAGFAIKDIVVQERERGRGFVVDPRLGVWAKAL